MKTKLFTFFLVVVCCCSAMAQSRVWKMPGIPADTTIVREWQAGKYIVYSRQGTNQTFSYHDNMSPVVRTAQFPIDKIVNDFRIVGDKVYAGGTKPGSPTGWGFLTCFDINDLLGSGGVFDMLTFGSVSLTNAAPCNHIDRYDKITGVKRLTLFDDGGVTHVAFIADDTVSGGGGAKGGCRRVGYGDVAYLGGVNGTWNSGCFNYNEDADNRFSDITVTDNHVVLVSRDCLYDRLEFVLHDKVANYVCYAPLYTSIYYFTDHKVLGRVMVTALGGDAFAVAYHYEVPTMGAGLAVKVFGVTAGVPALQYSLEIPPTSPSSLSCEMKDIRYVRSTGELWILNDIVSPVTGVSGSYLYRVDMGNVYAGTYEVRYIPGYKFNSLDGLLTGVYAVSGSVTGLLGVHVEQNSATPLHCTNNETVKGQKTAPVMQDYIRPVCPIWLNYEQFPEVFTVNESSAEKQCEYMKGGMQQ